MFVPKLSAPLTKAIRTSEGILVWLTNLGLAAGAVVDPSTLPPKEAAIVGSVLTGLHVASRTLLKVQALQMGVGIPAPASASETDLMEHLAGHLAERLNVPATVLDDASIEKLTRAIVDVIGHPQAAVQHVEQQVVSDAEEFASQPPAVPVVRPESAVTPDTPVPPALVPVAPVTTPADAAAQTVTGA
ncbi:MAG TPA: hypothetical protein VGY30_10760 [Solirubrobacteraceae bacterium]|jgi:hypothetical protein|nr:hypothetical protein [Solirubrobacteraceae bacterium]